jgi:guanylate kinase
VFSNKGKIFIISGPSGSGKTTLYQRLLASPRFKDSLVKTVSVTTRAMRPGERNGRDYFFVSPKMFFYKRRAGHFLESMKVFDNYYGTPLKQVRDLLRAGKNILLCIDVQGARIVWHKFPQVIKIFVKTSSVKELARRLKERGSEDKSVVRMRMKTARKELKEAKHYDHIIINDHLPTAYLDLERIVRLSMAS